MAEHWVLNSATSMVAFSKYVERMYSEHKYITFDAPRIGADRSLPQNSLFHVWATKYSAHILRKDSREISTGELDGMKRVIKQRFNASHPACKHWMTYTVINPFDGQSKLDYTSSRKWKSGEMFMVLEWLQMMAAQDGLILESVGVFAKNQRVHNG